MTENQKSFITWVLVLLMTVATVSVLVFTVPDLSGVKRIVYRANTNSPVSRTVVKTEKSKTEAIVNVYPLDINTATKEQLMAVPGIGETYADRIINYREEYGDFDSLDELLNVQGIGEKRLESFSEYLAVME